MYLTSKNRLAEGRFGTMFKQLPAFAPSDELLTNLAKTMVEDQTVPDGNHLNTSPVLFAGFTFIGQFIDHDITFDTTPLNLQLADPDATVNFEQRVTTSIRSTDADRRTQPTTRPTGTNCSWRRTSTVSSMCRVTATAGPSSRTHAMTRT